MKCGLLGRTLGHSYSPQIHSKLGDYSYTLFEKEPEQIDEKIEELKKQKYTTVVIPNELASFSEDIISKYKYDNSLNIIITPYKDK